MQAAKRALAIKAEGRMLETFTNRKLADLGCRFDARERRSQGRFQLFPRSLAGHGVVNKEGKELVSEMPSVTGQQSDPLGHQMGS